jgi:hypothetical protein
MQMIPGKLDCTRIDPCLRSRAEHNIILSWVSCLVSYLALSLIYILCPGALQAQSPAPPPQYPEVGWLARSSYCNPYFGFRLRLPPQLKSEPVFLPVQPSGRHMLLDVHLQRLDRTADLLISAFEDSSRNPARLAANARARQARERGLNPLSPRTLSLRDHEFYRLQIVSDTLSPGNESSYFFALRGYVLHIAIFSHERDLTAALDSAIEHLEFVEPGESACQAPDTVKTSVPAAIAAPDPAPAPARLHYGPALPTDLVESTLRESPGYSVPSGQFSSGIFANPALGIRVALPPRWQALPPGEAHHVTELMHDPSGDPENADRRRALFRACSRVVFTAADVETEIVAQVHPGIAILAMPQGCVPDMALPPASPANAEDRAATEEFATVMARSLGVPLLSRGSVRGSAQGHFTFDLDGSLGYRLSGEMLSRRLNLRVSATGYGSWLIFIYSVTGTPAEQRELESHITIGIPDPGPASNPEK